MRRGGQAYEAVAARREHRERRNLFHSALRVRLGEDTFAVEMAPAWGAPAADRGVVAHGSVGLAWLGHSRLFRYEIRRWREGVIPDASEALGDPVSLSGDPACAQRILDLVPSVPTPVWGRDELDAGEMWNSNSVVSWLLTRGGVHTAPIQPPRGGRAPGWDAGLVVAARR